MFETVPPIPPPLGTNTDGSLSSYTAHLVANGCNQQHGIDCDETFSLVVKLPSIRTYLSLAVSRDWPIHHLDMKNAFLHGHLSETVYLYMYNPCEPHLASLKRILRYVRGTLDHGLQFHVSTTTQLTAYTDVDWAGS
ncbi:ribonuclease H-like domain-containing protein [Tanacetum coccineum]